VRSLLKYLMLVAVLLSATPAMADTVMVKAQGVSDATFGAQEKAFEDAKLRALEKYISGLKSQSEADRLISIKPELFENINEYVKEPSILSKEKQAGNLVVTIQAQIDVTSLNNVIRRKFASDSKQLGLKKKRVAFVFVAREVQTVTSVKDHNISESLDDSSSTREQNDKTSSKGKLKQNSSGSDSSNDESISAVDEESSEQSGLVARSTLNGSVRQKYTDESGDESESANLDQSANANGRNHQNLNQRNAQNRNYTGNRAEDYEQNSERNAVTTTKNRDAAYKESKNTNIQHAEEVTYRLVENGTISSQLSEIFTEQGMRVADTFEAADLMQQLQKVRSINQLRPSDLKKVIALAQTENVDFLCIGTLDVDREAVDSATGSIQRYVLVNANAYSLAGDGIEKAAAVGNLNYSGVGENPEVAKNNAINNATRVAGSKLVAQLRNYIMDQE